MLHLLSLQVNSTVRDISLSFCLSPFAVVIYIHLGSAGFSDELATFPAHLPLVDVFRSDALFFKTEMEQSILFSWTESAK